MEDNIHDCLQIHEIHEIFLLWMIPNVWYLRCEDAILDMVCTELSINTTIVGE